MAEITDSSVEEFLHNPVWRQLRDDLRDSREALYKQILDKHSDLPECIEIKLINQILTHVQGVKQELKEK